MATRTRRTWKLDNQGQYARQIGWKLAATGKLAQHKFRLGADLKEAQRREQRLRELWECIEADHPSGESRWDPESLDLARQIAQGSFQVSVSRHMDEEPVEYARRLHLTQRKFSMISVVAEDQSAYAVGAYALKAAVETQALAADNMFRLMEAHHDSFRGQAVATGALPPTTLATARAGKGGPRLHEAMEAYIGWIKRDYFRPALGRVNDSGRTKIRQVETLLDRHNDMPLASLDYQKIEEMVRLWRQRPFRKNTERPISRISAQNYIAELMRFFRWLHRSPQFDWRRPEDFDAITTKVDAAPTDQQRKLAQVQTYSLDELATLNRLATPLERVLLLLGLNCAFNVKEIATLTIGEVFLFQGHDKRHQEILGYQTTNADSFIKRVRRKSGVYGEFILFPATVQAMQWALERRREHPRFEAEQPLLLNSRGEPYDKITKGGHRNQQIPNRWGDLTGRIQAKHSDFPKLSFGKLRKTAGDLIRRFADGEVAGVFLAHGQAVKSDDLSDIYTNRPFGKVFAAIRKVEDYLRPVFDAAGPEPFPRR